MISWLIFQTLRVFTSEFFLPKGKFGRGKISLYKMLNDFQKLKQCQKKYETMEKQGKM